MRSLRRADVVAILVASITATSALVGTALGPIVGAVLKSDPPPMSKTCIEIATEYESAAASSKEKRTVILGEDGPSPLLSDPQAIYCKITIEQIRRALPPPEPR